MKAYKLTIAFALVSLQLSAQELMKVELKEGKTVEYKVDDVKRVYFDATSTTDESEIKTTSAIMFVGDTKIIEGDVKTTSSLDDFVASVKDGVIRAGIYGTKQYPNKLLNDIVVKKGVNANTATFENRFIWTQEKLEEEISRATTINCSKALVLSYKKSYYGY